MHNGKMDHVHGFDGVLAMVLQDPEHVDIVTEYGEYSEQEIQMVKGIKRAVAFIQSHHRPMTTAELRKNRAEIGVTNNYVSTNEVLAISNKPGQVTLKGFNYIKDSFPDVFEVCLIVEKDGHLTAGCWDTGLWSTKNGKPGSFRQSRGGVIEPDDVLAWLPIEEATINIKDYGGILSIVLYLFFGLRYGICQGC